MISTEEDERQTVFDTKSIPTFEETIFRKFVRKLFAKQILSITKDEHYILAWYYKNGNCEIVDQGKIRHGSFIDVSGNCQIIIH